MLEDNLSISMLRHTLDDLPEYAVPEPFSIRWYQPGDAAHWVDIHVEADEFNTLTKTVYDREFGVDEAVLAQRQAFLCNGQGTPIGTASAWFEPDYTGQPFGQVHWVAIRPRYQGRGLSKPLLSAICQRMFALGDTRAFLHTSTARIPAIQLYLKFGFVPEIRGDGVHDRQAWRQVKTHVSHPAIDHVLRA